MLEWIRRKIRRTNHLSKSAMIAKGDVPITVIGNDVLIGCNSVIKSGVTVGTRVIIGAGAVVISDVSPFEIVGGTGQTYRMAL